MYKHVAKAGTEQYNEHSKVQGPREVKRIDLSAAVQNYVKMSIEITCIDHQNSKAQTQGLLEHVDEVFVMPSTTDDGIGLAHLKHCDVLKHWKEVLFVLT